jgi:NitT/TauT family transport system permease protein
MLRGMAGGRMSTTDLLTSTRVAHRADQLSQTDILARRAARRRREAPLAFRVLPAVVVGILLLATWQALVWSGSVASFLLPAPLDVADAFWRGVSSKLFWRYGQTTLMESLIGFGLGAVVALPVGYGIARSRLLARALEPYLAASQAVPAIAIAPLLVLWLGYGLQSVVILCALIVFFPVVVNTALGIRMIDRDVLDAARVDGASGWPMLLHFEAPLALPSMLAGLRTSLTLSITGAVVGEFVIGDRGLGGLLTIARGNFDTPLAFATLFMLMLMASALYGVARLIESRLLRSLEG